MLDEMGTIAQHAAEVAAADEILPDGSKDSRDEKLPRLRSREVLASFFDEVLEFEMPILKTVISLTVRPGTMCREYIAGYRRRYSNPMRYAFLTATLMVIMYSFFDIDPSCMFGVTSPTVNKTSLTGPDGEDLLADPAPGTQGDSLQDPLEETDAAPETSPPDNPQLSEEEIARRERIRAAMDPVRMQKELTGVVNANLHWLSFFTLPFIAAAMRLLVFRKAGLNFAEHYAFVLFVWGHTYLFDAFAAVTFLHSAGAWGFAFIGVVAFIYECWAAKQFYQQTLWVIIPKMVGIIIFSSICSSCIGGGSAMIWFVWRVWDLGVFA